MRRFVTALATGTALLAAAPLSARSASLVYRLGKDTVAIVQHTRTGTWLIVNKQVGQWGTVYTAANDVGRVPMQMTATPSHVEEITMVARAISPTRGAIEMLWGPSMVSVPFTATAVRP